MVDRSYTARSRPRHLGTSLAAILVATIVVTAAAMIGVAVWNVAPDQRMQLVGQGLVVALVLAVVGGSAALQFSRTVSAPLDDLAQEIDDRLSPKRRTLQLSSISPVVNETAAKGLFVEQKRLIGAMARLSQEVDRLTNQRAVMLNATPDPLLALDAQGEILCANHAARQMFGLDSSEDPCADLTNVLSLAQILPAAWHDQIRADMVQFGQTGQARWIGQRFEVQTQDAHGVTFPAEFIITPLTVTPGRQEDPIRFLLVLRDIAPQRSAQMVLRQSRASLMAVIENTGDGIASVDRQGNVLVANSAFKQLLRDAYGLDLDRHPDALTQELPHPLADLWSQTGALALHGARLTRELDYSLPGGNVTLETTFNPIVGVDGQVQGISIFVRDITGHKRVHALLRYRGQLQQTIARISTEFIHLKPSQLDRSISQALAEIGAMVGVDRGYILRIRPDGSGLMDNTHEWCAASVDSPQDRLQGMAQELLPWWNDTAQREGQIYIHRVADLPVEAALEKEILGSQGIQSMLAMPMSTQGEIMGFVGFETMTKTMELDDDTISLLRLLADIFVNAFQRQQAEEILADQNASLAQRVEERTIELRRRYQREAALASIEPNIGQPDELDDVLARVANVAAEMLGVTGASLLLRDPVSDQIEVAMATSGLRDARTVTQRLRKHAGITRWIVDQRKPLAIADLSDPALLEKMPESPNPILIESGLHAFAGVPLLTQDEVVGVLYVIHNDVRHFSESEMDFLTALANRAALAVSNLRIYETLQQANRELARAARLKDDFLASMSHELRTPLNAILGMAESLQEEIYGHLVDDQRYPLEVIRESGHHLLALINDILDLSRIEAGQADLYVEPVNVESICYASMQFVRQAAKKKQIHIHMDVSSAVSQAENLIWADQRRLKQILVNLLSNAVKFTPEGGEIGLEVAHCASSETIQFVVWDTGIGIAEEQVGRLFQPFAQLDSSLNRRYNGTGLGLALVYRMAKLHGGSVGVESTEGVGSRFNVVLPCRPTLPPFAEESGQAPRSGDNRLGKPTVRRDNGPLFDSRGGPGRPQRADRPERPGLSPSTNGRLPTGTNGTNGFHPPEMFHPADLINPARAGANGHRRVAAPRDVDAGAAEALERPMSTMPLSSLPASSVTGAVSVPPVALPVLPPVAQADLPSTRLIKKTGAVTARGRGPKVLLVEDNPANVKVVREYLARQGCEIICAYNGEEGLKLAASAQPEIILMDIQMPGMDGLTAIKHLRRDENYAQIPILALTALAMPGDKERCLAAGANQYMSKPVSLVALYRAIQTHLKLIS